MRLKVVIWDFIFYIYIYFFLLFLKKTATYLYCFKFYKEIYKMLIDLYTFNLSRAVKAKEKQYVMFR